MLDYSTNTWVSYWPGKPNIAPGSSPAGGATKSHAALKDGATPGHAATSPSGALKGGATLPGVIEITWPDGKKEKLATPTALAHNYILNMDFQGEDIWVATALGLSHGIRDIQKENQLYAKATNSRRSGNQATRLQKSN
jgi:hypothetical protein